MMFRQMFAKYVSSVREELYHGFWTGVFVAGLLIIATMVFEEVARIERAGLDIQTRISAQVIRVRNITPADTNPKIAFLTVTEQDCRAQFEDDKVARTLCEVHREAPLLYLRSIALELMSLPEDGRPAAVILDLVLPSLLFGLTEELSNPATRELHFLREKLCKLPFPVIIDAGAVRNARTGTVRLTHWPHEGVRAPLCPMLLRGGVHVHSDGSGLDSAMRRAPFTAKRELEPLQWLPDAALLAALYAEIGVGRAACVIDSVFPGGTAPSQGGARDCTDQDLIQTFQATQADWASLPLCTSSRHAASRSSFVWDRSGPPARRRGTVFRATQLPQRTVRHGVIL